MMILVKFQGGGRENDGEAGGRELGTLIFFGEFLGFTPKNTYVYFEISRADTDESNPFVSMHNPFESVEGSYWKNFGFHQIYL